MARRAFCMLSAAQSRRIVAFLGFFGLLLVLVMERSDLSPRSWNRRRQMKRSDGKPTRPQISVMSAEIKTLEKAVEMATSSIIPTPSETKPVPNTTSVLATPSSSIALTGQPISSGSSTQPAASITSISAPAPDTAHLPATGAPVLAASTPPEPEPKPSTISSGSSTQPGVSSTPMSSPPLDTTQLPATTGVLAATMPAGPAIKPGTFVYLVLGKAMPAKKWNELSQWPGVSVIFMTWRDDITNATASLISPRFRTYFFPESTWTTARNRLVEYAKVLEVEQHWRFEFLVFFDEDVVLKKPLDGSCSGRSNPECEEKGFRALNALLIRDRPMEAGVAYQEEKPPSAARQPCIRRCHRDHNLMAFHRTAVDFLLPYDASLDHVNWWSSAYIQNMFMGGLISDYCSYYREVSIDEKANEHRYYPHRVARSGGNDFDAARAYAARKLGKLGVSGFSPQMSGDEALQAVFGRLNPTSGSTPPCHTFPFGVDFHTVLASQLHLLHQVLRP